MDTTADSARTPVPGGAASPGTGGGTDAGAATSTGSGGITSREVSPKAATEAVAVPGRPASILRSVAGTTALVFDDPLDRPSADDTDRGWGDLPTGSADDDFARFLREKPPHHL
jgi:hypothetical protein